MSNTETTETTTVRGTEFRACYCGCKTPVGPKTLYRPGHDARHAGQVGRQAAQDIINTTESGRAPEFNKSVDADRLASLPSPALKDKAARVAVNALAKHNAPKKPRDRKAPKAKAERTEAEQTALESVAAVVEDTGTIKVGRWEYPVRMTSAGKVQRNLKRDGSGAWETIDQSANVQWAS